MFWCLDRFRVQTKGWREMINQILGAIYIGDDHDAESIKLTKRKNITAFLDLTKLHIDVKLDEEAKDQVKEAVEKLRNLLSDGHVVLVFCHAGIDRSPFVVAYYLYTYHKYLGDFQNIYNFVKERRPQTFQHWEWVSEFNKNHEE